MFSTLFLLIFVLKLNSLCLSLLPFTYTSANKFIGGIQFSVKPIILRGVGAIPSGGGAGLSYTKLLM